jgi:tripartite-type tricarboxylate transporter receptor subunit TctC
MFMFPKPLALTLGAALFLSVFIQPGSAADFPTRPIEIVIGYTAGSAIDLTTRVVADVAKKHIAQPVIVVNKPGAGGSLAALEVFNSRPYGYKLFANSTLYFALTNKTQKLMYDPDLLVPIAGFMEYKDGIVVKGDSSWKTLDDLIAYGKKNPGKIRWTHIGRGTKPYLSVNLIFRKAGIEAIDIPQKGAPEAVTAVLGGHADLVSAPFGPSLGHMKAGRLRALVNFSDRRYESLPQVPSSIELGFQEPGKLIPIASLFMHKDTPEEIKKILIDSFRKVVNDPDCKKGMEKIEEDFRAEGPEGLKKIIKDAEEVSVPLLKELGLYVER